MSYRNVTYLLYMTWNWNLPNWPHFNFDAPNLASLEKIFLQNVGGGVAILRHLDNLQKREFIIEILCSEGVNSAEIEGETLERESLQSSIQKHFGLNSKREVYPKEKGMAELLFDVYSTFEQELSHEMLHRWHKQVMAGESKIENIGCYRTHEDPMQIIAGRYDKRVVYFEAPPSKKIQGEMSAFIRWFNGLKKPDSLLAQAAVCHVYFESIHPFEDGNGRLGRALVEKLLSRHLGYPALIAVSQVIMKHKKAYYQNLSSCNRTLNIQGWVEYFAQVIVQAQQESLKYINFLMNKSQILNRLKGKLNARQEKVLLRMFAEGVEGFKGGLSAENYISITKTSRATATRDLDDLVEKGALSKRGALRHTRYSLRLSPKSGSKQN